MKKLRFLLFATLVAGSANAQYFQHVYGTQTQDILQSGVNTTLPTTQPGHIMVGYTDTILPFNSVVAVRTDVNGRIPAAPYFKNRYRISVVSTSPQLNTKARRVVQAPALGGRISVWGDYTSTASGVSTNFFYMLLNPGGVPGPTISYGFPFSVAEARATSMCTSTNNPNLVYVCGYIRVVAGGSRIPIVMALNAANGAIAPWGFDYMLATPNVDWYPMDIIESPYNASGAPELALCGHFTQLGSPEDGCFFRIDEATGNLINPVVSYGTATNPGAFNAIDIARNPYPTGQPGFVMGGYYFNGVSTAPTFDSWAMKVSPTGLAIDFTTLHDYSGIPNNDDFGNDIIERLNTAGTFEYYLGGYVTNGVFGGNDDLVYKLDFNGASFPGLSQFTYGGPGTEQVLQLDKYENQPPITNGLSVYGNTANSFPMLGQNDFYLVKAYFNGVTACDSNRLPHNWMPGPGIRETWQGNLRDKMNSTTLVAQAAPIRDFEICWTNLPIAGGSNARIGSSATEQQLLEPGYFPNPVSHDNAVVTVTFGKAAVEGEAELELWNSLGQLCWSKKAAVADGQIQMEVQLGNELSGGMYHLIVKQNGTVNNYRIVVQ